MRRALDIWDMVQSRDVVGLSSYLWWEEGGEKQLHPNFPPVQVAQGWNYDSHRHLPPMYVDPKRAAPPPPGRYQQWIAPVLDLIKRPSREGASPEILEPAAFLVQRWINDHLKGKAAPHLSYNIDIGKRVLQIIPEDLLAAMWLQFAQAIDGNKEYRACKECGRWFEISHRQADGRTKRREFCSDACKSKDYRTRRDRAAKEAAAKPVAPKKRRPGK